MAWLRRLRIELAPPAGAELVRLRPANAQAILWKFQTGNSAMMVGPSRVVFVFLTIAQRWRSLMP
jgi:hypothetical protein